MNVRYCIATVALFGVFALCATSAQADTVIMNDGRVLQGTYVGGTEDSVRFQTGPDVRILSVDDIRSLTFSTGNSAVRIAPPRSAPPRPAPQFGLNVPAGTSLLIRMRSTVDSKQHKTGHRFTASLEGNLMAGGAIVAVHGTPVYGVLKDAKQARRATGQSELTVELIEIMLNGTRHPIVTDVESAKANREGRRSVRRTATAAGAGALIDGHRGARTGAIVGAAVSVLTRGKNVLIPEGTLLEFRLLAPLSLR